jgi:hypothetical protein
MLEESSGYCQTIYFCCLKAEVRIVNAILEIAGGSIEMNFAILQKKLSNHLIFSHFYLPKCGEYGNTT